jgi:membrane protein YdbS with pleckstrin-like domain
VTVPSPQPGDFRNDPLDVSSLPRVDTDRFDPLDPAYLRMRMTAATVFGAVVAIAAVAAALLSSSWAVAVAGAMVVTLVVLVTITRRIEVHHMGFLVREQDVSFRSGVISRTVATAPFARVQHVAIHRGPLDRRFGLATLQMRTAGGSISIPGLRAELAETLKQMVADRASELAEAEVDER